MRQIDLNGLWLVSFGNVTDKPVQVPGAIERVLEDRTFAGPFEYVRSFNLDRVDEQASYVLRFEGVSYACEVYCNGVFISSHEGIWDGFLLDVTKAIRKGDNHLMVKVFKPDFDKLSPYYFRSVLFGFIPDILMPFGGIWKDVSLQVRGRCYFSQFTCRTLPDSGRIRISSLLAGSGGGASLAIHVAGPEGKHWDFQLPYAEEAEVELDEIQCWSPDSPALYRIEISLLADGSVQDERTLQSGFRDIALKDGEILLNGKPFYMRGALHWGCYPDKFTPTPTLEEVRDELEKLKAAGFNAVKHCLYFPPSYYYELCDEMGIVTWQELPLWLPFANKELRRRLYEQYPKMLDSFMFHPSVAMVSLGCELDATIDGDTLNDLYRMVKERDPKMIVCDNSGSGECYDGVSNADSDIYDYHFYAELYHLDTLINEFTRSYRPTRPWLFGEYNDSDTFRLVDPNRVGKDDGAWWLSPDEKVNPLRLVHQGFGSDQPIYLQREILEQYGVAEEIGGIPALSLKQMHSIRKYILELTRSYKEIKGYNITVIKDTPNTTSGIFDEGMNPKLDPADLLKINGGIVVSLNKDLTRVWDHGGDRFLNKDLYNYFSGDWLKGRLILSNRSGTELRGTYEVVLREGARVYFTYSGRFEFDREETGQLAQLAIELPEPKTSRCMLEIRLSYAGGVYTNTWDIWVYPRELTKSRIYLLDQTGSLQGVSSLFNVCHPASSTDVVNLPDDGILVTTAFDALTKQAAERGLRVIAIQKGEGFFPLAYGPFFREGVKAILDHPVTDGLGHLGYAGMQFFGVGTDRYFDKLEMERKVGKYSPIIRRYDARKFNVGDYLLEYSCGNGRVLATTLNLDGGQGSQPNSFQHNPFAIRLLHAMICYLSGEG